MLRGERGAPRPRGAGGRRLRHRGSCTLLADGMTASCLSKPSERQGEPSRLAARPPPAGQRNAGAFRICSPPPARRPLPSTPDELRARPVRGGQPHWCIGTHEPTCRCTWATTATPPEPPRLSGAWQDRRPPCDHGVETGSNFVKDRPAARHQTRRYTALDTVILVPHGQHQVGMQRR